MKKFMLVVLIAMFSITVPAVAAGSTSSFKRASREELVKMTPRQKRAYVEALKKHRTALAKAEAKKNAEKKKKA